MNPRTTSETEAIISGAAVAVVETLLTSNVAVAIFSTGVACPLPKFYHQTPTPSGSSLEA